MKKRLLTSILICLVTSVFAQSEKKLIKTYGGIPTENKNMQWENDITPNEKYFGIIQLDTTIVSAKIIEAFMVTHQPLQDSNIMTKRMRSNNAFGATMSALGGDYKSMDEFSKAGEATSRLQNKATNSWTVQFIDGVGLTRFYYNVVVQAKNGKYKLTIKPSGISGYANNHIQKEWSDLFKNGKVKSIYSKNYNKMKIKLAYTIDQWINAVEKNLSIEKEDNW